MRTDSAGTEIHTYHIYIYMRRRCKQQLLCKIAMIPWHHFIILYQITYIFLQAGTQKTVPMVLHWSHVANTWYCLVWTMDTVKYWCVHGTIQHVCMAHVFQSIVIVEICIYIYSQWVFKCNNMYCIYIYILYHTYIHTYVRTYVRMYACMYVYIYSYIHTYIHVCVCACDLFRLILDCRFIPALDGSKRREKTEKEDEKNSGSWRGKPCSKW